MQLLEELKLSKDEFPTFVSQTLQKKKYLVLWVVTDCDWMRDAIVRMRYVTTLMKEGLKVEGRGPCFKKPFSWEKDGKSTTYKFYLALENSRHCKDYITEKMFTNAFRNNAVPIVWGATKQDYQDLAPPNSFIYAEDYSPEELVRYIDYLDKNNTAYLEYFKWRTMNITDLPMYRRQYGFCQLCRVLNGVNVDNIYNPRYKESYSDIPLYGYPTRPRLVKTIKKWFYESENKACLAPNEY